MTSRSGVRDSENPSAKMEDRCYLFRESGTDGPLHVGLSGAYRIKIRRIRSTIADRKGSVVHSEHLISMLEGWLLDEEQRGALASNPLNVFYLHAAAYLLSEKNNVKDNGIGMNRYWLEKYFLNIGISFYKSGELGDIFGSSGLQMGFISNFGIGFLSTFLFSVWIRRRVGSPFFKTASLLPRRTIYCRPWQEVMWSAASI